MMTTLPVIGALRPVADDWSAFLKRRDSLTAQMELDTCNGCDDCGLRCMDGITVTRSEYDTAIAFAAGLAEEVTLRVGVEARTTPWPGAEDTGATVTWCRYRDHQEENCAIYDARPTVCRFFGHAAWLPCPTGAVTKVPADTGAIWDSYRDFERHTWAEWDEIAASNAR